MQKKSPAFAGLFHVAVPPDYLNLYSSCAAISRPIGL